MPDEYPIWSLPDDAPEDIEQMGSKEKFWFRRDESRWLFKYPRENSGEHWAEKIVAELAVVLQIPAARVEFAEYRGRQGSASLSFADRTAGRALVHGNEVLAALHEGYDRNKKRKQSEHHLQRIIEAVSRVFGGKRRPALERLAEYVVLDALVGNVDRHHENWGLLLYIDENKAVRFEVAPSFDHASSLGRELRLERCVALLHDPQGVSRYIAKGSGGIYLDPADPRGASPLLLAREANRLYPDYFSPVLKRIADLDISSVRGIISRVPKDWMQREHRIFAESFILKTRSMLLEVAA